MRSSRLALALTAALSFTLTGQALADVPAVSLVTRLASAKGPHPLADASGRIPVTVSLPWGEDARALGLLPVAPGIGAARLLPSEITAFAAEHPALRLGYTPPLRPLLDWSQTWTHAREYRKATSTDGAGVIVGIIDTGLDIRHPDFRDRDGKTRVAWMLEVDKEPAHLHTKLEDEFGCTQSAQTPCAIYAAADLDAMIAKGDKSVGDSEGHGSHVTSIAAGNGGPMINQTPKFVGVAPGATLVIVNASGKKGFFDSDVLNAARFIFDRAEALGMPAVINLSVGGDFGPHDGTTDLEKGLAAMVGEDKAGRAIVTAAGNSGTVVDVGNGERIGNHTEAHVSPAAVTRVPIYVPKSITGEVFVWSTFRPGDDVEVALEGPGGETWIGFTSKNDDMGYDDGNGNKAGVINNVPSADLSLTPETNSAVVYFGGAWESAREFAVLMRGQGEAQLWLQGQGQFDADPYKIQVPVFKRALKQGTVAVPASHPSLLAVGCTINRTRWKPLGGDPLEIDSLPDGACSFSSAGPTPLGVPKPEISAPGALVAAAMSEAADPRKERGGLFDGMSCPSDAPCTVVDEYHAIASGTSMSAPQVTGAVALLFAVDPTLTQPRVTEILQAGARRPTGHVPYDFQIGSGVLDLQGALAVMGEEEPSTIPPDLSKSWITLSSGYARPDSTWPVWGTVQLRRADGLPASGLDETKLSLSVTNGIVVQPLTRLRHGTFRFAVAGESGMVGSEMTIDVRYEGASLGLRTLPIGTDVWTSSGEVDATGGTCGCNAAGSSRGSWSPLILALAGLALRSRRARRGLG